MSATKDYFCLWSMQPHADLEAAHTPRALNQVILYVRQWSAGGLRLYSISASMKTSTNLSEIIQQELSTNGLISARGLNVT